jgi:hypothetical protein
MCPYKLPAFWRYSAPKAVSGVFASKRGLVFPIIAD